MIAAGWQQVRPDVEVKRSRFSTRMEKALRALTKRVAIDKLKDRNKIERRLGSIQARHPRSRIYTTSRWSRKMAAPNSNGSSSRSGGTGSKLARVRTCCERICRPMIRRGCIILPTTNGREIRLRRITTPSAEQKRLLEQLGITLSASVLIKNVVQTRRSPELIPNDLP